LSSLTLFHEKQPGAIGHTWAELQHTGRSWGRLFPALYYQTWHWMTDAKLLYLKKKKAILKT